MSKAKSHTIYRNKAGDIVVGTTTVINLLDKPAIHHWIARITKEGYDWTKYRDDKADIGTLAHALILADLKGEACDTSEYSKEQMDQAENCYLSWLDWRKGKDLKPVLIETPLVSEKYQFGGSLDYYGLLDGVTILADYKTGGIWKEATIQTCAYRQLLIENGYPAPEKILILGIPRTEDEKFQEVTITSFDTGWQLFLHLREIYKLNKRLK